MTGTATQAKPAPGAGSTGSGQQASPPMPWAFPVGTFEQDVQDIDQSVVQSAAAQLWGQWNISPSGWLRGAWIDFLMSVTGNVTNSVTYSKDNPFSGVQKLTVYDLGGEVVVQVTGYQLMILNKYGGYFNVGDPRGDMGYSATTGTGGTAGTFHFVLYVPLEVIGRSALGVVQNESKPGWRIEIYVDSQANTYNQVPSTFGTLRIRGYLASYTDTQPAGYTSGNTIRPFAETPPLPGTLQYWKVEGATLIAAGSSKYDLTNGIGFPLRNVFYLFYDASAGTRAAGDGDIPDPFVIMLGNLQLYNRSLATWHAETGRDYGFYGTFAGTSNSNDNAFARENGILPFYRTLDFANEPGNEYGYKYWATNVNTLLRLQGSFGAQTNLFAMVNWIQTPSKNRYQLVSGGAS
ncbi:MAG TPA: hypothetical protein VGR98_27945 [Streptosporangiaceae bacterium]|nr:hypothetical protein [Streptosporangiaceae bacterium]